mmetsp:Transcript_2767/g.7425  ORF Transcript_2767/g.7425 Transcript_2767/m.7425 type:complete len:204 (+) Transcript_2767:243-854(+)
MPGIGRRALGKRRSRPTPSSSLPREVPQSQSLSTSKPRSSSSSDASSKPPMRRFSSARFAATTHSGTDGNSQLVPASSSTRKRKSTFLRASWCTTSTSSTGRGPLSSPAQQVTPQAAPTAARQSPLKLVLESSTSSVHWPKDVHSSASGPCAISWVWQSRLVERPVAWPMIAAEGAKPLRLPDRRRTQGRPIGRGGPRPAADC